MAKETEQHPRLILHNFLSPDLCKELELIHKSNCTVGYRPNVFSTTLSHLIATDCAHLIMPFVPIRGSSIFILVLFFFQKPPERKDFFFLYVFWLFVSFEFLVCGFCYFDVLKDGFCVKM